MQFSIAKTALRLLILLPILLSGCVEISEVRQPASGQVNMPFTVDIDVATLEPCPDNQCNVALSVSLPTGWPIQSCSYSGSINGACTRDAELNPDEPPTEPTNTWSTFSIRPIVGMTSAPSTTATLRILPTTPGTYNLSYRVLVWRDGAEAETEDGAGAGAGADEKTMPITISAITAVPTMGAYGYGLLALVLTAAAALRMSRSV